MTPYTLRLGAGTRFEPSAAIPLYAGNAATALQDYEKLTVETAKAEVASAVEAAKAEVASAVAASGAGDKATIASLRAQLAAKAEVVSAMAAKAEVASAAAASGAEDKATIASLRAQLAMRMPQHGADYYVLHPQPFSSVRSTSVVCRQFQRGHCKYGDSCKFSHLIDGGGIRGGDRSKFAGLKRLRDEETHPPPYGARQGSFGGGAGREDNGAEPPYGARQGSFGGSAGRGGYSAEGMSHHLYAAQPPLSAHGLARGETSFAASGGRAGAYRDQDGHQRPVLLHGVASASGGALPHSRAPEMEVHAVHRDPAGCHRRSVTPGLDSRTTLVYSTGSDTRE